MTYSQNQDPRYGQQPPVVSGPPAQYGPPPATFGYVPQQPPAPKKRKWPWIVGGVLLVMILGCVGAFTLFGIGAKKAVDSLDSAQKGANAVAGQLGKPSTDGKFQFTVTGMKCGINEIGGEFGQKAQGQFCEVSVQVKNVGKSSEIFNDSSQHAYDAAGTEYSVDSGAAIFANKDYQTFLEQINPGNTVRGVLVFDVPQSTKLTSVVLHESMFTPGIRVPLT